MKRIELFVKSRFIGVLSRVFRLESAQMYTLSSPDGVDRVVLVYNFLVPGMRRMVRVASRGEVSFERAISYISALGQKGVQVDVQAVSAEEFDAAVVSHPVLRPSDTTRLTVRFRLV